MTTSIHGMWSSRLAFILAATGSAVGLGNVWRFPYMAGENGGGAFVLVYILCAAAIGIPIMIAEIMLGRRGRQSPINTMRTLAAQEGRHPAWQLLGWMGLITAFLILSFYSVVAGWTLAYMVRALGGAFDGQSAQAIGAAFDGFLGNPEALLAWHTIFMLLTAMVVARGVAGGLERAVVWMMPALFVMLLALVGYAGTSGHFAAGLAYMFTPDFSKLSADGVLSAMGQAFFSLSLGMGAIMIYGSYLDRHTSIARSAVIISATDTPVALLAGVAIFPLVFAYGLAPQQGPGLVFKSCPSPSARCPAGGSLAVSFSPSWCWPPGPPPSPSSNPSSPGWWRTAASPGCGPPSSAGWLPGCWASPASSPSTSGPATPSSARACSTSSTTSRPTSSCPWAAS